MRGENQVPRISYLEGEVELMTPSDSHEDWSAKIARLLETWSIETGIPIRAVGSWTLKRKKDECGAEPDECYVIGRRRPRVPDLAVEVVWTSGSLDKLDIYKALGVRE